jgi:predicted metal-binding membrane protein
MPMGPAVATPTARPWTAADFGLMLAMWAVMMVAMMLPSAAPMLLLHAAVLRQRRGGASPLGRTALFALGYLLVWTGFSVVATVAQWWLHGALLLTSMMGAAASPLLGGALLLAAGAFQWTPVKRACLHHCRSPIHFLAAGWREGVGGTLAMGLRHGLYCVGCCWFLMALLFVGGVMNLLWVAGIAAYVLVEKLAPAGHLIGRAAGLLLVAAGAWTLTAALF